MRFDKGYVKLHRKLGKSWIAKDGIALAVWDTLLRWAAYMEGSKAKAGKHVIAIKPGQVVTSAKEIADQLGFDRLAVERRLKLLESDHSIEQQVNTKGRIITICNWQDYQSSEIDDEHQTNIKRTSDEHQMNIKRTHNKEVKNIRKKEDKDMHDDSSSPSDVTLTHSPFPRKLVELWNEHSAKVHPKVRLQTFKANSNRYKAAKKRLDEQPDLEYWLAVIKKVAASDFCSGRAPNIKWVATFDFLVRPETHIKVMEGQYDNRSAQDSWERPADFFDEQPF